MLIAVRHNAESADMLWPSHVAVGDTVVLLEIQNIEARTGARRDKGATRVVLLGMVRNVLRDNFVDAL